MDDFFSKFPIFNRKMNVLGYQYVLGPATRDKLLSASAGGDDKAANGSGYGLNLGELSDNGKVFIDFSNDLLDENSSVSKSITDKGATAVLFGKKSAGSLAACKKIKDLGYKVVIHSYHVFENPAIADYADIIQSDFPVVTTTAFYTLIKQHRDKAVFLASRVENWQDFEKAADMGFSLFQGNFFLTPTKSTRANEISTFNTTIISVLRELDVPQPSYLKIASLIEHDLGLSYKLLRLVNSAYLAPAYRITTISQAIVYLGTRELHQWLSMLMLNDIKTEGNSELIKVSLIRGKLMAIVAQKLQLPYTGSNPFFTGLFSLIDVILNKSMDQLLSELPFSDDVNNALRGRSNDLQRLLNFVIDYEQARIQKIECRYPIDQLKPENMVQHYIDALKWSRSGLS